MKCAGLRILPLLALLTLPALTIPTFAEEPDMNLELPALLWGLHEDPDGGVRYWVPEDIADLGANLLSVSYRPLNATGERTSRVGMLPLETLREILEDAQPEIKQSHDAGIRIIGYADAVMISPEMEADPAYDAASLHALKPDGTAPVGTWYDPRGVYFGCINNPRWLELQKKTLHITAEAGIDGLMLDAYPLAFPPGYQCHCEHCRDLWQQESKALFGESQPMPGDEKGRLALANRLDREYLTWRFQTYVDFVKALEADITSKYPDFILSMNHNADTLDFGYQALKNTFSYPSTECSHIRLGEEPSLYTFRHARALMDYPMLTVINAFTQIDPPWRLEILLGEAQASGGAVYTAGYRKGTVYEVGQRHYGMMRAFPEWFAGTSSTASVGLIYSWRDHAFVQQKTYGPTFRLGQGDRNYRRAGALLSRHQIPYDCLVADVGFDGGDLARYDVIVAPDVRLISDDNVAALEAYVANGGTLVRMGEFAGLREEQGQIVARKGVGHEFGETLPEEVLDATETIELPEALEKARIRMEPTHNMTATVRRTADRIAIHLIRYGDPEEAADQSVTVRYPLPKDSRVESVRVLSPDADGFTLDAVTHIEDGLLTVTAPALQSYGLVGIQLESDR